MLDNSFVQTSNLPISQHDTKGNTYQIRTLDDGSSFEVVKNFPNADEARSMLGPRARDVRWMPFEHCWMLAQRLSCPAVSDTCACVVAVHPPALSITFPRGAR